MQAALYRNNKLGVYQERTAKGSQDMQSNTILEVQHRTAKLQQFKAELLNTCLQVKIKVQRVDQDKAVLMAS